MHVGRREAASSAVETASVNMRNTAKHFLTYFSSLGIHCIVWPQTVAVCKASILKSFTKRFIPLQQSGQ